MKLSIVRASGQYRLKFGITNEEFSYLAAGLRERPRLLVESTGDHGLIVKFVEDGGMALDQRGNMRFATITAHRFGARQQPVGVINVQGEWGRDDNGPLIRVAKIPDEMLDRSVNNPAAQEFPALPDMDEQATKVFEQLGRQGYIKEDIIKIAEAVQRDRIGELPEHLRKPARSSLDAIMALADKWGATLKGIPDPHGVENQSTGSVTPEQPMVMPPPSAAATFRATHPEVAEIASDKGYHDHIPQDASSPARGIPELPDPAEVIRRRFEGKHLKIYRRGPLRGAPLTAQPFAQEPQIAPEELPAPNNERTLEELRQAISLINECMNQLSDDIVLVVEAEGKRLAAKRRVTVMTDI